MCFGRCSPAKEGPGWVKLDLIWGITVKYEGFVVLAVSVWIVSGLLKWPDASVWLCLKMAAWFHLSSSLIVPSAAPAFLTARVWVDGAPSRPPLELLTDDTVSDWTSIQSWSWSDSVYEQDGCVGQCVKLVLCSAGLSNKQPFPDVSVADFSWFLGEVLLFTMPLCTCPESVRAAVSPVVRPLLGWTTNLWYLCCWELLGLDSTVPECKYVHILSEHF